MTFKKKKELQTYLWAQSRSEGASSFSYIFRPVWVEALFEKK